MNIGDDVRVVSGPHEGRGGRIIHTRDISIDQRQPETYAVIEFRQLNAANEAYTDHISVPVRRLAKA